MVSESAPLNGAGVAHQAVVDNLKRSEDLFALLVSSVKDYAIFMLDVNGHVMTWNEGAKRIKGYSKNEIVGQHFSRFYTPEAVAAKHPQYELKVAAAEGRYEEEGWRVRKDGSRFWANVLLTAVRDADGRLLGFAKVTRDLTERRAAEQARREVARLIEESNEELQHLAYVVSHELQSPSATIARYCNLLSIRYQNRLGDDANDFMNKMSTSSKLITRMIDDLWTYARVSKRLGIRSDVNMNKALDEALQQLSAIIDHNELTCDTLPSIPGDEQQFVFLFKELIYNAIRYRSSEPPKIGITVEEDPDGWLFAVKDNGIGIDKVAAGDIFKVFHRVSGAPGPDATGMGLAICRKIVRVHHGKIWYESELGQGSIFYFWLPKVGLKSLEEIEFTLGDTYF